MKIYVLSKLKPEYEWILLKSVYPMDFDIRPGRIGNES